MKQTLPVKIIAIISTDVLASEQTEDSFIGATTCDIASHN